MVISNCPFVSIGVVVPYGNILVFDGINLIDWLIYCNRLNVSLLIRLRDEPESTISETGMFPNWIVTVGCFSAFVMVKINSSSESSSEDDVIAALSCRTFALSSCGGVFLGLDKQCFAKWPILLHWWQVLPYAGHFVLPPCGNCPPQFRHCLRIEWRVSDGVLCWFFAWALYRDLCCWWRCLLWTEYAWFDCELLGCVRSIFLDSISVFSNVVPYVRNSFSVMVSRRAFLRRREFVVLCIICVLISRSSS